MTAGTTVGRHLVVIPIALVIGHAMRHPDLRWPSPPPSPSPWWPARPFVQGYGRDQGNPSLLPRSYGAGTAAVVGAVLLVAPVWMLANRRLTTRDR